MVSILTEEKKKNENLQHSYIEYEDILGLLLFQEENIKKNKTIATYTKERERESKMTDREEIERKKKINKHIAMTSYKTEKRN